MERFSHLFTIARRPSINPTVATVVLKQLLSCVAYKLLLCHLLWSCWSVSEAWCWENEPLCVPLWECQIVMCHLCTSNLQVMTKKNNVDLNMYCHCVYMCFVVYIFHAVSIAMINVGAIFHMYLYCVFACSTISWHFYYIITFLCGFY